MSERETRRQWALGTLGLTAAAEMAAAWQHAHQASQSKVPVRFETLDPATAGEIEAITSQIIPSDGSPGAREAGVIYFIDRALGTWEANKVEVYRKGIEDLQTLRRGMFPGSASLSALSDNQLKGLIAAIEKSAFFELLRTHTVLGFYGAPSHGGNRGGAGWAHIGLQDRMLFEPPFGYYDAAARQEGGV